MPVTDTPGAVNDSTQDVAAQIVRAERVARAHSFRGAHHSGQLLFVGIVGREVRTDNADQNEQQNDHTTGKGFGVQARQYVRKHAGISFSSGFEGQ